MSNFESRGESPPAADDLFNLSHTQYGVWVDQLLNPDVPLTASVYFDLADPTGSFDPVRLGQSYTQSAHEFVSPLIRLVDPNAHNDEPQQYVDPDADTDTAILDFSGDDNPMQSALAWMQRDSCAPVEMVLDPMVTSRVLRISDQRWLWYLRAHRVALDLSGLDSIVRRTCDIYACLTHRIPAPEINPLHPRDIAASMERYLESRRYEDDCEYWRSVSASLTEPCTLSGQLTPATTLNHRVHGDAESIDHAAVVAAAERLGTSPLSLLTAAFAAYVNLATGRDNTTISLPVTARNTATLQKSAGSVANILPLATNCAQASVASFVREVTTDVRSALRHHLTPAVDIEAPRLRTEDTEGTFGPVLAITSRPPCITLADVIGCVVVITSGPVEDIAVTISDCDGEFCLDVECNPAAYSETEAQAHHRRLCEFISTFVTAEPCTPIRELPFASADDTSQLPQSAVETQHPFRPLSDYLEAMARSIPDEIAISDGITELSYRELDRRANQIAHQLHSRATLTPESIVVVYMPRCLEAILATWAITKAGTAALGIDPSTEPDTLSIIAREAQPVLVVSACPQAGEALASDWLHALGDLADPARWIIVDADSTAAEIAQQPADYPPAHDRVLLDHPLVVADVGVTRYHRPALVSQAHRPTATTIERLADELRVDGQSRVMQLGLPGSPLAVVEMLLAAIRGGTLVVFPPGIASGAEMHDLLTIEQVTVAFSYPSVLDAIPSPELPSLEALGLGHMPPGSDLIDRWAINGRALVHVYAHYETGMAASISLTPTDQHPTRIGPPVAGAHTYVLDRQLRQLPPGVPGELYISGPFLARGYLQQPALTASRFIANPYADPAVGPMYSRMYRTGDIVRRAPSGDLELLSRAHSSASTSVRLDLAQTEKVLAEIDAVHEAIVVPSGLETNIVLTAYVTGPDIVESHIVDHLHMRLPSHLIPQRIVVLADFPRTSTGHIDRSKLALLQGLSATGRYREPQTDMQWLVATAMGTVLGQDKIGLDDSFVDRGGDDLATIRLAARLSIDLDARIPVHEIVDHPTVSALAERLTELTEQFDGDSTSLSDVLSFDPGADDGSCSAITPQQQHIWTQSQVYGDKNFTTVFAFRLVGILDVTAAQHAVTDLVMRHQPLRTRYLERHGLLHQDISDVAAPELETRTITYSDLETTIRDLSQSEFDLTAAPPVRFALVTVSPTHHYLLMASHAIVTDVASSSQLAHDWVTAYTARRDDTDPRWRPLEYQFADFSIDQHNALQSQRGVLTAFWRAELHGAPTDSGLPTFRESDNQAPATHHIHRISHSLDVDLSAAVNRIATQHEATTFMVLHAALVSSIAILTQRDDVVIGTPFNARDGALTAPLVGCFSNDIPLRVSLSPDDTFGDVIDRVRSADLSAFAHAALPFGEIAALAPPPPHRNRHPVFQIGLKYVPAVVDSFSTAGLNVSALEPRGENSPLGMSFTAIETFDGRLTFTLDFAANTYDKHTATAVLRSWVQILERGVADTYQRIRSLEGLGIELQEQFTQNSLSAITDAPETITVRALLTDAARRFPNHPALIDGDLTVTYRQLLDDACCLAGVLLRHNGKRFGPDAIVATYTPKSSVSYLAYWAVALTGASIAITDAESTQLPAQVTLGLTTSAALADAKAHSPGVTWIPLDGVDTARIWFDLAILTARGLPDEPAVMVSSYTRPGVWTISTNGQVTTMAKAYRQSPTITSSSRVISSGSQDNFQYFHQLVAATVSGAAIVIDAPPTPHDLTLPTTPAISQITSSAMLLDSRLHPVPFGMPGEIYLVGLQVPRSYLGLVAQTATSVVANPITPGERAYRTGAIARWIRTPNGEASLEMLADRLTPASATAQALLAHTANSAMALPDRTPLSYRQQHLWLLNRMSSRSATQNHMLAMHLAGPIDTAAMSAAIVDVTIRHESLRTRYPADDHGPWQQTDPPGSAPTGITRVATTNWAAKLKNFAARPFDLSAAPPLRSIIIDLGPDIHVLGIVIHPIAADAASVRLVASDLLSAYAQRIGHRAERTEPIVTMAEYASWQRTYVNSPAGQAQRDQWIDVLADLPEEVTFPLDRQRPPHLSQITGYVGTEISAADYRSVVALATEEFTAAETVVHAALAAVLARMSGASDVPIARVVSPREHPSRDLPTGIDLSGTVGQLINNVVVRIGIDTGATFLSTVRSTREAIEWSINHSDYPLERLLADLKVEQSTARNPLCQVRFGSLPTEEPPRLDDRIGVVVTPIASTPPASTFDVDVTMSHSESGGLTLGLHYAKDLYHPSTMQSLVDRVARALISWTADPSTTIGEALLHTPTESSQLLSVSRRLPTEPLSLPQILQRSASWHRQRIAVESGSRLVTYAELTASAKVVADQLVRTGVGPERIVSVVLDRGVDSVLALWSVALAGGVFSPLDPRGTAATLRSQLAHARPFVGITHSSIKPLLPPDIPWLCIDEMIDGDVIMSGLENPITRTIPHLDSTAVLTYDSAYPRPTRISHRGLAAFASDVASSLDADGTSRVGQLASPGSVRALGEMLLAFYATATCVIAPASTRPNRGMERFLREKRVTHACLTATSLANLNEAALPQLSSIAVSREQLSVDLIDRWSHGRTMVDVYGYPETTFVCATGQMHTGSTATLGRPVNQLRALVLDASLRAVPVGVAGELYLSGPGLAAGYHRNFTDTATYFVANPYHGGDPRHRRMYRTGDLVRWTAPGADGEPTLELLGRVSDPLVVGGSVVNPTHIASVVATYPGVSHAVVRPHTNAEGTTSLVAYWMPDEAHELTQIRTSDFLKHCANILARHLLPSVFIRVNTFPLTRSGTLDVHALPDPAERVPHYRDSEPQTDLEWTVCQAFARALGVTRVGRATDLFESGGTSLTVIRVVDILRTQLPESVSGRLSVHWFFHEATPAAIAERLSERPVERPEALDTHDPFRVESTSGPTLFTVHPAVGLNWNRNAYVDHLGPGISMVPAQARPLARPRPTPRSIYECARDHVNTVLDLTPDGSFVILGWSLGGLVAHAMACELRALGIDVTLVLVDCYPLANLKINYAAMDFPTLLSTYCALNAPEGIDGAGAARLLGLVLDDSWQPDDDEASHIESQFRHLVAIGHRFLPDIYDGDALFLRTSRTTPPEGVTPQLWQPYVSGSLTVHDIEASHDNVFAPELLAKVGSAVTDYVQRRAADGNSTVRKDDSLLRSEWYYWR